MFAVGVLNREVFSAMILRKQPCPLSSGIDEPGLFSGRLCTHRPERRRGSNPANFADPPRHRRRRGLRGSDALRSHPQSPQRHDRPDHPRFGAHEDLPDPREPGGVSRRRRGQGGGVRLRSGIGALLQGDRRDPGDRHPRRHRDPGAGRGERGRVHQGSGLQLGGTGHRWRHPLHHEQPGRLWSADAGNLAGRAPGGWSLSARGGHRHVCDLHRRRQRLRDGARRPAEVLRHPALRAADVLVPQAFAHQGRLLGGNPRIPRGGLVRLRRPPQGRHHHGLFHGDAGDHGQRPPGPRSGPLRLQPQPDPSPRRSPRRAARAEGGRRFRAAVL